MPSQLQQASSQKVLYEHLLEPTLLCLMNSQIQLEQRDSKGRTILRSNQTPAGTFQRSLHPIGNQAKMLVNSKVSCARTPGASPAHT